MAQVFMSIFFSLAAAGAVLMIAAMLRREWTRVASILSGAELTKARASTSRVQIRQRAWGRPEPRLASQRQAVAA